MKNRIIKILSLITAILVLTMTASMLFACNPKDDENERIERDRRERTESVDAVKEVFLSSIEEKWSGIESVSDIAALEKAGDYVVVSSWFGLIEDVLIDSQLQTGKLRSFANFMQSDDGEKLMSDFNENAELLIPLLKSVNFTATDISNLVYDLLCALVTDSGAVIDSIISTLEDVRSLAGVTADKKAEIGEYIADMNAAKQNFVPTSAERENMLAAFGRAKTPLSELVSFAYNISLGAGSEDLFEAILGGGEGALADISTGEIVTLVGTFRSNLSDLKEALQGDAVSDLNRAFALVIEKFDNGAVPSVIFSQILQYAKSAYMLVDVIPALCDIAYAAGEIFDSEEFVGQLRECYKNGLNDNAEIANLSIIVAKAMLEVKETFSENQLTEIITELAGQSKGDYQKSIPLIGIDLVLNMSNIFDLPEDGNINLEDVLLAVHPEIMDKDTVQTMISVFLMISDNSFEKFRQAYNVWFEDNKTGNAGANGSFSKLQYAASFFKSFKIANPFNEFTNTQAWAKYYLSEGLKQINKTVDACLDKTAEDLSKFINEFYDTNCESNAALKTVAQMPLFSADISDAEFKEFMTAVKNSRIIGIVGLLSQSKAE